MSVPIYSTPSRYALLASLVKMSGKSWEAFAGTDNQPNDYLVVMGILEILDTFSDEIPVAVADAITNRVSVAYTEQHPFLGDEEVER